LLNERDVTFTYREYTKEPLSRDELVDVLQRLGKTPHEMLRGRDAKKAGIDPAAISSEALLDAMADNPRLLQRPILLSDAGARVGRPPEQILELL
jgi:arsenate reductase